MRHLAPLLLLLGLAVPARAETAEEDRRAAATALVARLQDLAKWCHDEKLFGARDRTYGVILHFAPDHSDARAWLKYVKAKNGVWKQDPRYKEPKDFDPKLLPDF